MKVDTYFMLKKIISLLIILFIMILQGSCQGLKTKYSRYQSAFFAFDTVVQVVGYTQSQKDFDRYAEKIHSRFIELHHLYDRFTSYDGINNICTINQHAGITPVTVAPEILDLIELGLQAYTLTQGTVNIALGPVLDLWHHYINFSSNENILSIPSREMLETAKNYTNITKVHIDRSKKTIFLEENGMLLDLGGIAKGYATQLVADEIYADGFTSFIINAGGNVVAKDAPLDDLRNSWGIGIQNPQTAEDPQSPSIDVVFVQNQSVVSSGDYQRYAMLGNTRIHHLIDPFTLYPANHYRGITVVCNNSGMGDIFSTALFIMDFPSSLAFAQEHGLMALWIFDDGQVKYTQNLLPLLRDRGGATSILYQ